MTTTTTKQRRERKKKRKRERAKERKKAKCRAREEKEERTCMGTNHTPLRSPPACLLALAVSERRMRSGLSNQTSPCKNGNRIGWILLCKHIHIKHSKYHGVFPISLFLYTYRPACVLAYDSWYSEAHLDLTEYKQSTEKGGNNAGNQTCCITIACVYGLESKASNPGIFWKLLNLKLGKHTWISTWTFTSLPSEEKRGADIDEFSQHSQKYSCGRL